MFPVLELRDGKYYVNAIGVVEATILISIVAFIVLAIVGYFAGRH